jgi:chemotaxis protein MotB
MRKQKVVASLIHEEPEAPENHERWLVSYADFITLLMVFFVVLYSMSKVDVAKYEQLAGSLNAALSGGSGIISNPGSGLIGPDKAASSQQPTSTPDNSGDGRRTRESERMEKVEGVLRSYFFEHGINTSIFMEMDERGLIVSLKDTILFDLGSAEIKSNARSTLITIGNALNSLDNYIRVEGHTDNLPIRTARFRSNWELSAERATTVVRLLIDAAGVPPEKLSAVGYGEYKPVADNSTEVGRSQNRRVNIILLYSRYNELENSNLTEQDNTEIQN